jgi:hypothetical protein
MLLSVRKNCRGRIALPRRCYFDCSYDLWQHLAQPAASLQHFVQVTWSLQQLPSQAMAGLALSALQQVLQPVVIRIPAAKTAARIIIDFILFNFGCSWICLNAVLPIAPAAAIGKFL